jgi:cell division protein FtsN
MVDKTIEEKSENITDNGTQKRVTYEEKIPLEEEENPLEQKIQTRKEIVEKKVTDKIRKQRKEKVFAKQIERKENALIKEGNYYLQIGVFRSRANAIKLASQLEKKGFKTKTLFTNNYTVVIVGYFEHKNEALVARKLLKESGYDSILKRRK